MPQSFDAELSTYYHRSRNAEVEWLRSDSSAPRKATDTDDPDPGDDH